jgi:hypothetical protein
MIPRDRACPSPLHQADSPEPVTVRGLYVARWTQQWEEAWFCLRCARLLEGVGQFLPLVDRPPVDPEP